MGFIGIGSNVQSKINPSWFGTVVDLKKHNNSALVSWEFGPQPILTWSYLEYLVVVPERWKF